MEKVYLNGDIYVNTSAYDVLSTQRDGTTKNLMLGFKGNIADVAEFLNIIGTNPEILDVVEDSTHAWVPDYTKNMGFYHLLFEQDKIYLINALNIVSFDTLEDMEMEYTNLREFMDKAFFVGRNLFSKELNLPAYIVLFEYENIYLVQDALTGKFEIAHKNSFDKYELGNIVADAYEKDEIYKAIIDQEYRKGFSKR